MLNISCLLSPPNSLWANVGCWAVVGRGVKGWHASSGEAPISGSQLQRVWGSAADSYRSTWLHTLMLTDNVPGLGPPCVDMWVCAWMCVCLSAKAEVKATDMHTLYSHWILLVATTSSYSLWLDSSELLWCGSKPPKGSQHESKRSWDVYERQKKKGTEHFALLFAHKMKCLHFGWQLVRKSIMCQL